MTDESSLEHSGEDDNNIGVFEEAVVKAEQLGKAAREAAEKSTRTSQEALKRAETISRETQKAAEESARAAQKAINKAEGK